jgi:sulfide:quinone oxidoreductase
MPMPAPVPPSPPASEAFLAAFAERGIEWHPQRMVTSLDVARSEAVLADGSTMPYDLFLGIPKHTVPRAVAESGMTVNGWIPVDPLTLETHFPDVYAVGDVTSVGTPKAGVFAEGQAAVVAEAIIARVTSVPNTTTYGGTGTCYVEFGHERVARVNVTFLSGQAPVGGFDDPSSAIADEKAEFGSSRVRRWLERA